MSARLLPAGRVRAGMTVTHLGRRVTVDGVRKQALDMSFEGLTMSGERVRWRLHNQRRVLVHDEERR